MFKDVRTGCEEPLQFLKGTVLSERNTNRFVKILIVMLGLFLAVSWAPDAAAQQKAPAQDPVAMIRKMCDYLKSLKQFSFRAEITADEAASGGRTIQYGLDMQTYVKRPDRVRVNAAGDLLNKEFFFNGKSITLYDRTHNVYGAMDVPPGIEAALEKAYKDFGLTVALTDLASPMLWEHISRGLERPSYAGKHKVRGIACHHIVFDRGDNEFQVWIDAGAKPLPRKILVTTGKREGSPHWEGYIGDWKTSAVMRDGLFQFVAPRGAQKIQFVPMQKTETPLK
jgi:hypothetical protein